MIADTLLVLALALPPRPALVRAPALVAPSISSPVLLARVEESSPDNLTTCYQSRTGSCWTED